MTDANPKPVRRYGNYKTATISTADDVPLALETVAAEIREALSGRPDLGPASLVQATVRIAAFNDGIEGPTHRIDWALELPVAESVTP